MGRVTFDDLDRKILHGLRIAPRVSFRHLADVLGVADQTVARRFHRLRADAGLRIAGRLDNRRMGWEEWLVRIQASPDAALALAHSLALRDDTSWVSVLGGGNEIAFDVITRSAADRDSLLLGKLSESRHIAGITAYTVLHEFTCDRTSPGYVMALRADQEEQLDALGADAVASGGDGVESGAEAVDAIDVADNALVAALARNGRATHAELAASTGWNESTVRRRIERLTASDLLSFDVDVDDEAVYGMRTGVMGWIWALPSRLEAVGTALAGHEEVAFAAATTGPTNLVASVRCPDNVRLYRYLSERLGGLDGVLRVETSPVIRTLKRSASLLRRER